VIVGTPTEIKDSERRVGLTAVGVRELTAHGHTVLIQSGAGVGAGVSDRDYENAGGKIVTNPDDVFAEAEMIVKVKEPQAVERAMLRPEQLLFTYLHLAPDADQTRELIDSGATAIAYETITSARGGLPLLAPMSKVAGRLSVQAAAWSLESTHGGAGMLLGGVPGVAPAKVVIIGGGVVGENAAQIAIGMGADVTVMDRDLDVLEHLSQRFGAAIRTIFSTKATLEDYVLQADVVIGAVLVRGARAPRLVTAEMVKAMHPGSVMVDVAIDQGGAFETSHATTHRDPVYLVDDVVHYAVANMPGAVPKTSTYALTNATLPYVLGLADRGLDALRNDEHFRNGLNVHAGHVTEPHVADTHGYAFIDPATALN
jgi:alanine dehydrogenase